MFQFICTQNECCEVEIDAALAECFQNITYQEEYKVWSL